MTAQTSERDAILDELERYASLMARGQLTSPRKIGTIIRKRISALRAAGDAPAWQPIETAPRDGTAFLAWQRDQRGPFKCWWNDDMREAYWMDDADSEPRPTHWQPLPAPPLPRPERLTEAG